MSAPVVEPQAVPNPATTHWVPVGPGPLPDFRYRGDWAAGSYSDGDIVVYGGVAYLCVLPTSAAPTPWAPPSISPSYGTTLPASPVDGQEHVLVDSVTAPTYQWRFRYNAQSTSAYKWEFVGGQTAQVNFLTAQPVAASTWTSGEPHFAVPRAGDYDIAWTGTASFGANPGQIYAAIYLDSTLVGDVVASMTVLANGEATYTSRRWYPGINAGQVISCGYYAGNSTIQFKQRFLYVVPRRVS